MNPVNDVPTATITPASYAAAEQVALTLHGTGLSIADVDAASATVQATVSVGSGVLSAGAGTTGLTVSGSGTGTVTLSGTITQINSLLAGNLGGTLTYTADTDAPPASTTLTLTASDLGNMGSGGTLSGSDTATIDIAAVNDAPVGDDDAYGTNEDTSLAVPVDGVLLNDADPDGDTISAVLVSAPAHAAAFTLNADGSFSYTPTANWSGHDSFTYRATDGSLDSNIATVTISVSPVNDAPVQVFTGTNFNGVYSYNDFSGNWFVQSTPVDTGTIQCKPQGGVLHLSNSAGGSSSSGVIVYFDGALKLGGLQGGSFASSGNALTMNVYLDTGNDGQFFSFSGAQFTGLNGDSYGTVTLGANGGSFNDNTVFTKSGGIAALPSTFTLGQLKAGAVTGIDAQTRVAFWIGGGNSFLQRHIEHLFGGEHYRQSHGAGRLGTDLAGAGRSGVWPGRRRG